MKQPMFYSWFFLKPSLSRLCTLSDQCRAVTLLLFDQVIQSIEEVQTENMPSVHRALFLKKQEKGEFFCSITKTVISYAEQRCACLFPPPWINWNSLLLMELKASSPYISMILQEALSGTFQKRLFIQIYLLLFLILAGIRHFNRSSIFRFFGQYKRYI